MLTLDTSGLIALFDRKDPFHSTCVDAVDSDSGPLIVSTAVLAEIAWLLEARFPPHVEDIVVEDMCTGAYTLDWHDQDLMRVQHLIRKYRGLPLGLADAAVIACAERRGGRVLTTDFRHFPVVARGEKTIELVPGYGS